MGTLRTDSFDPPKMGFDDEDDDVLTNDDQILKDLNIQIDSKNELSQNQGTLPADNRDELVCNAK